MISIRKQDGVAALLTAIFVAIFISILTIGLSDVLNTEQSQTLDVHNSNRAQQAAEAGVEDALARIKYWADTSGCIYTELNSTPQTCAAATQISNNTCPSTGGTDSVWEFTENAGSACWIHRSVSSLKNNESGSLVADTGNYTSASTAQINLGGQTKTIVVNWGTNPPVTNCSLSQNPWPNGADGALELTNIAYDDSGNIATPVKGVMMPKYTSPGIPCVPGGSTPYSDLGTFSQCPSTFDLTTAAHGNQYKFCSQIDLSSITATMHNAYLRLRARFSGIKYSVTALTVHGCNNSSCEASLPNNSLTIDVTGQSGSVYRRIIAQSTITNPQIYSIFDFVLFSENDLNKNYACVNAAPSASCQ